MSRFEIRVPSLGESVTEAVVSRWLKADGEAVAVDEPILELESEKANVEIPAERAGVLKILKAEGATVQVGDLLAEIAEGAAASAPPPRVAATAPPSPPAPAAAPASAARVTPLARRVAADRGVAAEAIQGSGRGGRVTKADVLAQAPAATAAPAAPPPAVRAVPARAASGAEDEERVPMSPVRRRIAERLVLAQHTAAILTTFNEVDMTAVLDLRKKYKERFAAAHGVSLGFMSFFARSCVQALQEIPEINAEIRDTDVVYKKYVHLGIAVSSPRGLVVPVVRHADQLSFAEIEKEIERLAGRARDGKLSIEELSGGTFSISNGGVFGSLLSTPILNPPQSGILGMHKIEPRPVVVDNQIVIRPMMYVALSYDHRMVDGQQAVTFLVRVKERLEDPSRLLLDV